MRLLRGTSRQALSIELGWDDLKTRSLIHKLISYFKIARGMSPSYLRDLIPLTVQQKIWSGFEVCQKRFVIPRPYREIQELFFPFDD